MTLGVFVHRTDSIYDDSPAERYQFPAQYLGRAEACVGDWVLYYEPVKVKDTRGYFAVARVQEIVPDPIVRAMFIAVIEPGSYLEFANPVPFSRAQGLVEQGLLNEQQRISGRGTIRSASDLTEGLQLHHRSGPWGRRRAVAADR